MYGRRSRPAEIAKGSQRGRHTGTGTHLPKLYHDLISRLRLARDVESPISITAAAHGRVRRAQGYSASMLIRESRVLQVATFNTLNLHHSELDPNRVLSAIVVIADEVDAQLIETVCSLAQSTEQN
jgi:hypothetical protein